MPPWTHRLRCDAAVTWAWVNVVVTAPAMLDPVGLPPVSSSGTVAWVVNDGLTGFDTRDRFVPGVLPLIPFPKVNCQLLNAVQLGWWGASTDGEIGWPDV